LDTDSLQLLNSLINTHRTASIGTMHNGSPFVSLVLFAPVQDYSSFLIHVSRLAHHTQDILLDPRLSLMIAEGDDGSRNPLTLARLTIQKHPQAEFNFQLGDFSLYRVLPDSGRFVAGFGKIFNITVHQLQEASNLAGN
jgi:putative heme iron utilization protein